MAVDLEQRRDSSSNRRPQARYGIEGAFSAALVLAVVGTLGWSVHEPWLFPSLGPTIVLQHASPHRGSGSLWNTLVGHSVGAAAGYFAVIVTGANHVTPEIGTGMISAARVAATVLAIALTILGQTLAKADHPPAAATTMLISLGAFAVSWHAVSVLAIGIIITAVLGHPARDWHRKRRGLQSNGTDAV